MVKVLYGWLFLGIFSLTACTPTPKDEVVVQEKASDAEAADTVQQSCQQLLAKIHLPYANTPCLSGPISSEQLLADLPKLKNGYVDLKAANLVEDSQLLLIYKAYEVGFMRGKDYKILGVYRIRENVGMILALEDYQNYIENGPTQMISGYVVDGNLPKAKLFYQGRYNTGIIPLSENTATLQDTPEVNQFYTRLNKTKVDFRELNHLPIAEIFKEDFWLNGDELIRDSLSFGPRYTSRFNEVSNKFDCLDCDI